MSRSEIALGREGHCMVGGGPQRDPRVVQVPQIPQLPQTTQPPTTPLQPSSPSAPRSREWGALRPGRTIPGRIGPQGLESGSHSLTTTTPRITPPSQDPSEPPAPRPNQAQDPGPEPHQARSVRPVQPVQPHQAQGWTSQPQPRPTLSLICPTCPTPYQIPPHGSPPQNQDPQTRTTPPIYIYIGSK